MQVNTEILAGCFGITARRVQSLAKQGILVKVKRNTYDLEKSVQAYIDYKIDSMEASTEEESLDTIRAQHERIKMEKTKITVRLLEGKLHRAEDVERVMTQCAAAVKSRMLGIPVKTAPEIAGIEDIGQIQKILHREIADALNEVADYDPVDYADPLPIEEDGEDEAE